MEKVTEAQVDEAMRVLRRDYMQDVRSIAEECAHLIASQEILDEEALETWLHETIDGHSRVIYTREAKIGLLCSDNEDAYQDDFGEPAPSVEAAMYAAMSRDVQEELGDVGALFARSSEQEAVQDE